MQGTLYMYVCTRICFQPLGQLFNFSFDLFDFVGCLLGIVTTSY